MQQCMDLLKAVGGCVVNIGDIQVQCGVEGFSMYVAAKSALMSITKSASVEMAPFVRVNALSPGTMPWPENDGLYSPVEKEAILSRSPLKRLGEWSDLVHPLAFIQSATFVTGVCLPIDGGGSAVL